MVVLSEYIELSSSSSSKDHKYDVFLSFRGVDTRYGFTDHLHKALLDANISTFLDDEEIETGGDLKPELESAVKASRASIIVLSQNYANSSWCLDELVLILEQRMTSNQIVIPIFYHVEPTHIRKQESTFGLSMAEHKVKMEAEINENKRSHLAQKIDRWIKALTEVSNLKGENANGRPETEFIEEIVKDIYRRLCISSRIPLQQLFGMDTSIKFVTSWLKDASLHTTYVLTILGMGGIGKTSLAKYVYALHSHEFDTSSFIEDISRRCGEKFNGLLDLQKQLCDGISKKSSIQVHDVPIYTLKIENAVARKKVFIVLDDIDSLDQLDALLGSKPFHPGSKIIITTKDAWVTESCALFKTVGKPMHAKHLLEGLCENESQNLLCFHAFMCNDPKVGYEEVLEKLVKYCEGHPLALEVLGKLLHNRDVAYWEGCIEGLKKEISSRIRNVLRMSFDSLPSKNDQDLFKHIACFFVGMDRDITETILTACRMNTRSGIPNLIDRCLLSIGWNNEFKMHQLLQETGRFIVHQESPNKPWKRSRLWCHEESFKVLKQKKDKGNLLGLALDMRMLEKETLRASFVLKTDALSNMDNLRLLQLNYLNISGSYENFPEELRWLCMHGFPLNSLPLDYPMENLVVLDMSYSNIESFGIYDSNPQRAEKRQKQLTESCLKDKRLLGSLKILNLSFCEELRSLGGFEELPALERLIVTNCIGLLVVCESIEACVELFLIDLSYCNNLEKLPKTINMLKKVTTVLLEGCNLGESQMEIMDMDSREIVKAKSSSSSVVEAIPSDLKFFAVSLPSSLVRLSLANNNFSTESFPLDFSWLFMLKDLNLDGNPIVSLPNCVRSLPILEMLSMSECKLLTSVEHPPYTIKELDLGFSSKTLLRKVVFDLKMLPLKLSMLSDHLALSSIEIQGMVKIQPMVGVEEKVLCSLGWTNLDFLNIMRVGTYFRGRGSEESEIQMYYEFGIFSTIYGGKEMPNWISCRSKGPSLSFTIPSSPNNLRGLNFCYVYTFPFPYDQFILLPMITISNLTKNCTWIYNHYVYRVNVGEGCVILLSHWMFGMNEMEGGDQVTITTVTEEVEQLTEECGVSFVFDDGNKDEEEEEDVLGYYKSWNHIIGGDLSSFQATTGEYYLSSRRHLWHGGTGMVPFYRDVVKKDSPRYKEKKGCFRALSQR
ncbi:disease resistance protein RPV1 isoform X1 [Lactuca sativa]|uniref:disease resistance protein RPV1 isoform X1 n=1 Tax=Lactuca sativa TaxID=4236 RepID=UPI000CD907A4|nr:disease resistance protein RPV1 isoform X1 [Lactuca sativa]